MNNLEKEFVPYDRSLRLKALGFDESCFTSYNNNNLVNWWEDAECVKNSELVKGYITAPTFSQAFRWFRDKYGMIFTLVGSKYYYPSVSFINTDGYSEIELGEFESYEEAELTCLDKLIEIVETKSE